MATTRIQSGGVTALSITHDKLHTDMNLSTKTVVLPTLSDLKVTNTVGLGVTPGVWSVNYPALQIGQGATFTGHKGNTQTQLGQNWWVGTGNQYVVDGAASRLVMNPDSTIEFTQAPSGLAGAAMSTLNTRLIIKPTGYVGIGYNNPQGILHVKDTMGAGGDLWTAVGAGNSSAIHIQNDANAANTNAVLYFRNSVGEKASVGARFVNQSTGETELRFSTTNSSGTSRERFFIDGDGKLIVGLSGGNTTATITGSSSPSYTNHPGTNLLLKSGDGSGTGSSYMGFYTSPAGSSGTTVNTSQRRMTIVESGNVGIGTSLPLGKLTISNAAGTNAPSTVTAANTYLQLGSDDYGPSDNGKFMIGFGYTDATNTNSPAYIGYEEASTSGDTYGDLTFYTRSVITDTAPTERLRIGSSGNVGIGTGTDNPVSALDVLNGGSTYTSGLLLRNGSSTSEATSLYHDNTGYTTTVLENRYGNSNAAIKLVLQAASASPVTALTALGDGKVGIGTDDPDGLLDVRGDESQRLILSNQTAAPTNGESLPPTLEFHGRGWNTNQGNRFIKAKVAYVADYGDYGAGATQGSLRFSLRGAGGSGNSPNTEQIGMTLAGGTDSVPYPRLGIGTTGPVSALHIEIPAIAAGTDLQKQGIVVSTPFTSGYQYQSSSLLSGYDGALHGTAVGMVYESPGYALTFFTNNSTSGLPTEKARINKDGLRVVSQAVNSTTEDNIAIRYNGTAGGHMSGYLFRDKRDSVNAAIKNDLQDDSTTNYAAHLRFQTTHAGTLTTQMTIDRHGLVMMPNQSSFRAYTTTDYLVNGTFEGSPGVWAEQHDNNNDFSNGRFTAPCDGVYLFEVMWDSLSSQAGINLLVNTGPYYVKWEPTGSSTDAWESKHYSTTIKLSANDYVRLVGVHGSGSNPFHMGSGHWGFFSGHLLG